MSGFAHRLQASRVAAADSTKMLKRREGKFSFSNIGVSSKSKHTSDADVGKEPFSGLDLSLRYMGKEDVERVFEDKKVFTLSTLLAEMCPPEFKPPSHTNYILIAVVARKGEVRQTQRGSKFVMLTLTDLKYDLGLAIHDKSVEQYWKIQPGTVIAILNPGVYVTKQETRTLGLSITSGGCIMELGQSRDCGQCDGLTQNGKRCKNWIDVRKTSVCDYHQDLQARKAMSARPEFNSTVASLSDPKSGNKRMSVFQGGSVAWKEGLHPDSQAPVGKLYQSGAQASFLGEYDTTVASDRAVKKRNKRRADDLKNEMRIRKKLAQRADGFLLREFDEKGRLLNPEDEEKPPSSAFTPEQVRRLGFDPTAGQKKPKPANKAGLTQDSDSDLEII